MLQRDEQGALRPGSVLKDLYRIVRVLGRGGFAQTYLAEDLELNSRPVAIKEYLPSGIARIGSDGSVLAGSGSDGSREFARGRGSFLNEANALAGIKHPNVVDVLKRFEAHGTAYLVLAFEPGHTLEQRLSGELVDGLRPAALRIDGGVLIDLARALLSALVAVHAAGRVHGDIKPANLILRPPTPGRPALDPVLIDFGAARGDSLSRTATIMAVASAGYSPPEQYEAEAGGEAGGGHSPLVPASDLYALGATLYRVATGQVPVVSTRRQSALFRQKPDPLPKARVAAPAGRFGVHEQPLLDWIDSLMEQRVASAAEALRQLGKLDRAPAPAPAGTAEATRPVRAEERFPTPSGSTAGVAATAEAPRAHEPARAPEPPASAPVPPAESRGVPPAGDASSAWKWLGALAGVGALVGVAWWAGMPEPHAPLASGAAPAPPSTTSPPTPAVVSTSSPTPAAAATATSKTSDGMVLVPEGGTLPDVGVPFRHALRGGGEGPEMVVLPSGRFRMGSPETEQGRFPHEGPVREVTMGSFGMGVTELTFADWDLCVSRGGCGGHKPEDEGWGRGARPVINVSWEDAQRYVGWLRSETGAGYRLPSESEWEYAARAGTQTAYWWGAEIGRNRANCDGCGSQWDNQRTAPVKSFAANGFGLYDTAGNVWEWVADCYVDSHAGAPVDGRAVEKADCRSGVLRGASWDVDPAGLRSAFRIRLAPAVRHSFFGFRLALDR